MYSIWYTAKYKKDMKRALKRGFELSKLEPVVELLASGEPLPRQYNDHSLGGDWEGFRECHLSPDWLLIYTIDVDKLILTLSRTGTHSDLF